MAIAPTVSSEVSAIFAHYQNDVATIRHLHEAGEDARSVVREMTDVTDTFLLRLLIHHLNHYTGSEEPPPHLLLVAQGGFGRRELHPKSDIDIMFLHNKPLSDNEEKVVKSTLHSLYDLGFQVGHALRNYHEAIAAAQQDTEIQTALCESRFLAGDWRVFEQFKSHLWNALKRYKWDHLHSKVIERQERLSKYGDTVNLTEPHIKEGPGGLRDYHFGLWVGALLESRTMNLVQLKRHHLIDDLLMHKIENALAFLWRIRNDLHFHSGREQDLLSMSLQHELSTRLGYTDRKGRLSEEIMMRDYYRSTIILRQFAGHMAQKCERKPVWKYFRIPQVQTLTDGFSIRDGELNIPPNIHFYDNYPLRLLHTFIHAAEHNAELSDDTAAAVQDNLDLVNQPFLHDKDVTNLIRRFFSLPQGIEKAVQEMRRTGFLECLMPEWKTISCLIRYDLIHRYTVDEHSLLCLKNLESLLDTSFSKAKDRYQLWSTTPHRDVLRLAAMFHDIGKGKDGDHSIIGAGIVDSISRRIRLPENKRKMLVFLVENHLVMSRIAQRRDITDRGVVTDFSDGLENLEYLNMLYLLTFVDMSSVSNDSMNEWKNHLIWDLYKSTRDIFITNSKEQDLSTLEISRKEKLIQTLSKSFDSKFVREHLDNLPASYAINNSSDEIRKHLAAVKIYTNDKPVTRFYPHLDQSYRELVIVFKDRIGLFHQLCASVNFENFSIQEARLNTRNDGIVVNTIVIKDRVGDAVISEQRQRLLQERIEKTLMASDEIKIGDQPKRNQKVHHRNRKTRVSFINDSSTKYTILEIRTVNRNGLLKDLTGLAASKGLNLHFARIITEGEQVTDVFYLAGEDGEKIYNHDLLKELEADITNHIEAV